MTEQELYEKGWERFPWWWVLLENLLFFVPWVIGFAVMWPLKVAGVSMASLGYALFILATVGWLLKVHNCSTCYYYEKWCPLGWGKYAAVICKKDAGNPEVGMKLTVVYMILPLIPVMGAIAVTLLHGFSWTLLGWMVVFLVLNGVQFAVVRPQGCARCKKRYVCPGSAAGQA